MRFQLRRHGVLVAALSGLFQLAPASAERAAPGQISRKNADIVYTIAQQETLSSIASRFTGNARNWPVIARANGIANDRTIPIGQAITIPARLLPDKDALATVVALRGTVSLLDKSGEVVDGRIGAQVGEGTVVVTGEDGFITFQLQDGTAFALPPASNLQLTQLRIQDYTSRPRTSLTLNRGRITSEVTPFSIPASQYQVQTPLAIAGVRGTRFRINYDGDKSYSEVLHGAVAVNAPTAVARAGNTLKADFGSVVGRDGRQGAPVPLLPAPALDGTPALQERLPLRVALASADAIAWRVTITTDVQGMRRVADTTLKANGTQGQARFEDLPDGDYQVWAAAIDQLGLEGREARLSLRVKARPFAPLLQAPGEKLRGADGGQDSPVQFSWAEVAQVRSYHLQIARDAGFVQLVDEQPALATNHYAHPGLAQGNYFWRVASITDKNGQPDQGPWSDSASLAVLPPQQAPAASQDEDAMRFAWRGEAGQRFVFETAASADFAQPLQHIETDAPRVSFAIPGAGTYYARVQTIEADGYQGAFSAPQKYLVERRWHTGAGGSLVSNQGPVRGD